MIVGYSTKGGKLVRVASPVERADDVTWFDLFEPTGDERGTVGARLGIAVPNREDMEEIEESSRLYVEDGTFFMTASLPARVEQDQPIIGPVTFIMAGKQLVTVRYHEPKAFQTFPVRAEKAALGCTTGEKVLLALLDAVIDRLADVMERVGADLEKLSRAVFRTRTGTPERTHRETLQQIGRLGHIVSNVQYSLVSLERLIAFIGPATATLMAGKDDKLRVKTLGRDAKFLTEHAAFLSSKINFLLDATLGMINIEQNQISKILSVAAAVFLPPTLIASIYGMNFATMPELSWAFGYPFALGLMVASALLSVWYFKRQGWF